MTTKKTTARTKAKNTATTKANAGILRYAQDDDGWAREADPVRQLWVWRVELF
jgi:hypothetical protein